jgi:hypothetical protein
MSIGQAKGFHLKQTTYVFISFARATAGEAPSRAHGGERFFEMEN